MKLQNLFVSIFCITTLILSAQNTVLEKIEDKTWFENSGFTGNTVVFYQTSNGLVKAIRQINGSGVPVVSSAIYDVELKQDTVYLMNGLNLKDGRDEVQYAYIFNEASGKLMTDGEPLKILFDDCVIFAWSANKKNLTTQIDLPLLKELEIGKHEIYKEEDLEKTFVVRSGK
jgi:hypothetical protein